jgi:hypothetical protein
VTQPDPAATQRRVCDNAKLPGCSRVGSARDGKECVLIINLLSGRERFPMQCIMRVDQGCTNAFEDRDS